LDDVLDFVGVVCHKYKMIFTLLPIFLPAHMWGRGEKKRKKKKKKKGRRKIVGDFVTVEALFELHLYEESKSTM
jgi:hypothetical protein